jgi:hypothetical protein
MSYRAPSTPALERPHRIPDSTRAIVCLCCGDTMKHLRTLPKLGVRPEKLIFACPSCKGVEAKELIHMRHRDHPERTDQPNLHK